MSGLHVTGHAVQRALEMQVPGEEIRLCYETPEKKYWSRTHDAWTYKKGRLAIGVRYDEKLGKDVLMTILWATKEAWEAEYARNPHADRTPRADLSHLDER